MKTKAKNNIVYIFPLFLLVSACIWMGSAPEISPTIMPTLARNAPPTIEATVTSEQTASPTIAAGSFDDFQRFAAGIDSALQAREASFFAGHASSSVWYCLGDEILGVCKGVPADTTLEGVPVTYDWSTYEVHSLESYKEMWQSTFASHSDLKLVATANQFGDNPLMPMASQSFLAIVNVIDVTSSIQPVRVLFFEYGENTWHLAGELVTIKNAASWLGGTCSTCYDLWTAWQD